MFPQSSSQCSPESLVDFLVGVRSKWRWNGDIIDGGRLLQCGIQAETFGTSCIGSKKNSGSKEIPVYCSNRP